MAEDQIRRYADHAVEVLLPPDWLMLEPEGEDAPVVFLAPDERSRLTLSYFFYDAELPRDELDRVFDQMFGIRLDAEKAHLSTDDIVQAFPGGADEEAIWRGFAGFERSRERHFNGLIVAERGKLVTLYLESMDRPDEDHQALVESIFRSLRIK